MSRYLLRVSSVIGLAFGLLIGVAVGVGYLLPESLQSVHTVRLNENKSALYLFDFYRGNLVPLIYASNLSGFAQWSPDGKQIAYFASDRNVYDAYVIDRFGENKLRFDLQLNHSGSTLNWSPDGRYILIGGSTLLNIATRQIETLQYPIGEPNVWSPDSQTIRYNILSGHYLIHVYEIGIHCIQTRPRCKPQDVGIAFSPLPAKFGEVIWSPDKKAIAYSEYPSHQDLRIMVADLDCQTFVVECIERIYLAADTPLNDMRPIWSPDSTQLAFTTESYEIHIVNLSNFNLQSFTVPSGVNSVYNWSPDGRYISYYSDGKYNLLDVTSGQLRPLLIGRIPLSYPAWRPMQP